jgi:hypothetical protein
MTIEQQLNSDLSLDDQHAAGVAGGAVELGDGAGWSATQQATAPVHTRREPAVTHTRHAAGGHATTGASNRYQVLRNNLIG